MSYETDNWAKLSPAFRNAHNRLRQLKGLPTISPPKIDLYVPPKAPPLKPFDMNNAELVASARQFLGTPIMGPLGGEGFTINGLPTGNEARAARKRPATADQRRSPNDEGFAIR